MTDDEIRANPGRAHRELERLQAENERLRRRSAELEARLEEARRAGKRQAAPFSRNEAAEEPRRPGRHSGSEYGEHHRRALPTRVDETVVATLPEVCPQCGGAVEETDAVEQYQEDVPPVVPTVTCFEIHVGRCRSCNQRIQARHPRQTSDAVGAAMVQVGPRALSVGTTLHYEAGLSFEKIAEVLAQTTGVRVAASTLARAAARVAGQCEEIDGAIRDQVRAAPVGTPDETGWRVGGRGAWLWAAASEEATAYAVAASRGADVIEELLGLDYV